jgi:hypothetical protein
MAALQVLVSRPWAGTTNSKSLPPIFNLQSGRSGNATVWLSDHAMDLITEEWMVTLGLDSTATADDANDCREGGTVQGDATQPQGGKRQLEQRQPCWTNISIRLLVLHLLAPYVRGPGGDSMMQRIRHNEARLVRHLLVG